MNIEDYPEQEPFTDIGTLYHREVMQRAEGVKGIDLSYGSDAYQAIRVFPAQQPDGNVLCVMHGGGWTNGYKEWMSFMAPALNQFGICLVSIGYRLAPQHVYPAGLEDCCDGLALVHQRIAEWGGNPNRLFVGGHSAGGHYAALMALQNQWQNERNVPVDVIKGVLPISGTYQFGAGSGLAMRPRFLGPEGNEAEVTASPNQYIHADAPPFFVAWGEKDFSHLIDQAKAFSDSLQSVGVNVGCLELDDCDHLGASYASGDVNGIWPRKASKFIQKT
ncbi:MAG: arylformamidase [Gammaproteobacteria bacterium]|jgi:arylformamidase